MAPALFRRPMRQHGRTLPERLVALVYLETRLLEVPNHVLSKLPPATLIRGSDVPRLFSVPSGDQPLACLLN